MAMRPKFVSLATQLRKVLAPTPRPEATPPTPAPKAHPGGNLGKFLHPPKGTK